MGKHWRNAKMCRAQGVGLVSHGFACDNRLVHTIFLYAVMPIQMRFTFLIFLKFLFNFFGIQNVKMTTRTLPSRVALNTQEVI